MTNQTDGQAHKIGTTTVHDRIVEVVRRLGGDTNVCRTTIEAIPASEPNRLADALAAIVPARAILTSTRERRLLLAEHRGAVGWTVTTLTGQVRLMDMQLGFTLDDIVATVLDDRPDILGVSATFGQHDLLVGLLDAVGELPEPPLALAGGSLTARNERLLLRRYPWLLIARGAGEPTIADILAYWHGDLDLTQVRGIGYTSSAHGTSTLVIDRYRKTATVANRAQTDIFPELDLLAATFDHRGVAQLESSPGCTNYCSFCPRGHKGTWSGTDPAALPWIARAMAEEFDRYPEVSRTLYLVDEEFIGRGPEPRSHSDPAWSPHPHKPSRQATGRPTQSIRDTPLAVRRSARLPGQCHVVHAAA